MRYALVGYGRMGRAIDAVAEARGHRRAIVVDRGAKGKGTARSVEGAGWKGVDVAFEFTEGEGAAERVLALLSAGIPVVCGTTGWDAASAALGPAARKARAGAVIAPNFSIAMHVFATLAAQASAALSRAGAYDPYIVEWHHKAKRDAPSGTAKRLARVVTDASAGRIDVPVASVRAGHEPGRHVVGFDGEGDVVTLTHQARGRGAFAEGAVVAAEWIRGRRGIHGFDEVCRDLVRSGRR
ncbi:MAG TPA: dihydrodipicolinate reductase C-terminal domain-containing protein [Candidatus Binatia bacterium]|nr:dihydrodipicolinate reductase C-terminal domain-containing protein [Candidatus Binatia bacterium]